LHSWGIRRPPPKFVVAIQTMYTCLVVVVVLKIETEGWEIQQSIRV
jgi:hypothetical protein